MPGRGRPPAVHPGDGGILEAVAELAASAGISEDELTEIVGRAIVETYRRLVVDDPGLTARVDFRPVSYTHLDVYKRQRRALPLGPRVPQELVYTTHRSLTSVWIALASVSSVPPWTGLSTMGRVTMIWCDRIESPLIPIACAAS